MTGGQGVGVGSKGCGPGAIRSASQVEDAGVPTEHPLESMASWCGAETPYSRFCKEREYGVSGSSLSDTATGAALEKEATFSEKKRQRHQLAALKADLPQMYAPMPPPKFPEEGLTQRGRRERLRWNNAKRRCPRKEAVKNRSTTRFLSECFSCKQNLGDALLQDLVQKLCVTPVCTF